VNVGELRALPRLAEGPGGADGVGEGGGEVVAGGDLEREGAGEVLADGPERAPVAKHGGPGGGGGLDLHGDDVAGAGDVVDEDHEEPGVAAHGEADAALAQAGRAAVEHGRDAALVLGERQEGRLGQVEVGARGVAPGALGPRRAEVRGRDDDGRVVVVAPVLRRLRLHDELAPDLEAGAAGLPAQKQHRAQRRCHVPVPERHCVLVRARASLRPSPVR
jgi:hypothetical protein